MKTKTHKEMGLPTLGMLESFLAWWVKYKTLTVEGKMVGEYCKDWWLNGEIDEFNLFLRWLTSLIKQSRDEKAEL